MVNIKTKLNNGLDYIFNAAGVNVVPIKISYYINDDDYDEVESFNTIGSSVISGLFFPIRNSQGSQEALLLQQGKLSTKDKVLYTGSFNTSGNILFSINSENYAIIPDGIHEWSVNGSIIYNKIYLRKSLNNSLY